jgi:ABC-type transport system involved in cytochrome bd biosynthesis fused ATPase/permease subunit
MSLAVGSLVAWGAERGEALDPVAADAVVHLLALSGAKVRDGLPEATPDLVRVVLLEALPQFLPVSACAEGAALEVLRVLADRTRVDGRLNAKRHTRLREAVDACAGEHQRLMTDRVS